MQILGDRKCVGRERIQDSVDGETPTSSSLVIHLFYKGITDQKNSIVS